MRKNMNLLCTFKSKLLTYAHLCSMYKKEDIKFVGLQNSFDDFQH